jgi:dethiobiotin synthetase
MALKFFIVGTDTNVGKTYISIGLLKKFKIIKLQAIGIKPVSTGGIIKGNRIYNDDALLLQKNSSIALDYNDINSFAFLPPVSPNIAAKLANKYLTVNAVYHKLNDVMANHADIYIIEGVGGMQVPLNERETMADLMLKLNIPVILVVAIKLGCLNHAILTYQSLLSKKLNLAGWVANCLDPHAHEIKENIETLSKYITSPCLGVVGFNQNPEEVLNVSLLL